MIDISYIRSLFKYDPASGILFWDVKRPKVVLGQKQDLHLLQAIKE